MVLRSLSVESEATPPHAIAPAAAAARRRCFLLEQCCSKLTKPQHVMPHTYTLRQVCFKPTRPFESQGCAQSMTRAARQRGNQFQRLRMLLRCSVKQQP